MEGNIKEPKRTSIEELNKARIKSWNLWWRPALFKSAKELEEKIDKYFDSWYNKKKVTTKSWVEIEIPYITVTWLSYYLWFESRQSLYDYANKGEYSYIIKRAKLLIEREYEEWLFSQGSTWAIFALKNMWWKDKSEVENTNKNVNYTKDEWKNMSDEELEEIANG